MDERTNARSWVLELFDCVRSWAKDATNSFEYMLNNGINVAVVSHDGKPQALALFEAHTSQRRRARFVSLHILG